MTTIVITIPDEFVQPLNELVFQSGAVNRETWARNVIGNILLDYQVKKEFGPQMQQRMSDLMNYWS
jgi:hypothetical protein